MEPPACNINFYIRNDVLTIEFTCMRPFTTDSQASGAEESPQHEGGMPSSGIAMDMTGDVTTAVRKFSRRVFPLLLVLSVSAYLDRMNIAFAKLEMADDLRLSEAAFGLGASMYYIGYILFDLPSNAALARF